METLKYKLIKTRSQYNQYCKDLEILLGKNNSRAIQEEVELLTLLIEKWDSEHNSFEEADPICLLSSLMEERKMKPKDLVTLLNMSKGYVSEILHYKKGLSKDVIRKLAEHFKVSQEAFNRPYKLKAKKNVRMKKARVMDKKKKLASA
jgi:HTH-type transcriptional regulator/antitoxin HigA